MVKLLVAAAWADGRIQPEEITCLQQLIKRMPSLNEEDWKLFNIYLAEPIEETERQLLLREFKASLSNEEDRQLALEFLGCLIRADGKVTQQEKKIVEQMSKVIKSADLTPEGRMDMLLKRAEAGQTPADIMLRQQQVDELFGKGIFRSIAAKIPDGPAILKLPVNEYRKMALTGSLLAQVIFDGRDVSDTKLAVMQDVLRTQWNLAREKTAFVAAVAQSPMMLELDLKLLGHKFHEYTAKEERLSFLEIITKVMMGGGTIREADIDEVKSIATHIKLEPAEIKRILDKIPHLQANA